MSFMPAVGSEVVLKDGRPGVVTKVSPLGDDDRVRIIRGPEVVVTAWDIAEILSEPGSSGGEA